MIDLARVLPQRRFAALPWRATLLVCGVWAVTGCATVQKVLPTTAWREARERNAGYSLLYELLSQESDVAKILILKHADPPVAELIHEIARACSLAKHALDQFRETDRRLSFTTSSLPKIEQQTRAAIGSAEVKHLLFSSGAKFEARLLFTQAQAMNYAAHLAQVLHDQEPAAPRREFLAGVATRSAAFHDRALALLR